MLNGHTDDIAVRVSLLTTMTPDMLKNSSDTNIDTKMVCSAQGLVWSQLRKGIGY
jgi:hypothetical protein